VVLGVEKEHRKIKVKTSVLPKVHMGFSSSLKFISAERKLATQQLANSYFARKPLNTESQINDP